MIRIILTTTLLYFAWTNAHWSVALLLTLIFVGTELLTYQLKRKINYPGPITCNMFGDKFHIFEEDSRVCECGETNNYEDKIRQKS